MTLDAETIARLDTFVPPLRGFGRIGLLGGSFNPPHIAHVLMAVAVYATEELDHLWVIPTADHAFGKKLVPFDDRVRMCHMAFRHLAGGAAVVDIEKRLPRVEGTPSYTIDLLRALHAIRPGIRPVWIAGSDIIADLPKWKDHEEVQRLCRMVIIPRRGYEGGARLQIDLPLLSSTDVRTAIAAGKDVSGMIDREVVQYIERRELYAPDAADARDP